ncbi:MAG: hypothetical protein ABI885_21550 [Gammaproteobacteria bacterium]
MSPVGAAAMSSGQFRKFQGDASSALMISIFAAGGSKQKGVSNARSTAGFHEKIADPQQRQAGDIPCQPAVRRAIPGSAPQQE